MKAIIHQSTKDSQWYAEFKGNNNETWFVSEGYEREDHAVDSVLAFAKQMAAVDVVLEVKIIDKAGSLTGNFTTKPGHADG